MTTLKTGETYRAHEPWDEGNTRHSLHVQPQDWMRQAACYNSPNPDAWFTTAGNGHAQPAIKHCLNCPVAEACFRFQDAFLHAPHTTSKSNPGGAHMSCGIWAGLTAREWDFNRRLPTPEKRFQAWQQAYWAKQDAEDEEEAGEAA